MVNDEILTSAMRMIKASSIDAALANISPDAKGYIMPRGAALLPIAS